VEPMTKKDKKNSAKEMDVIWLESGASLDEVKRTLQANKYSNDETMMGIDEMNVAEPAPPFLVCLKDWPDLQKKDDFLAFSLLHPDALEILFQKEQNPLYAWRAYKNCRHHNMPIPDWALNYFDNSADNLLKMEVPDHPADKAYDALGLNKPGSGTQFRKFLEAEKKLNAACRVISLKRNERESEPRRNIDIYAEVAENYGISVNTLIKWLGEYKEIFS
jgi:hypothetical protein